MEAMSFDEKRRDLVSTSALLITGSAAGLLSADLWAQQAVPEEKEGSEPEVTATEDLMREHGVIRRALLVYAELADKVRKSSASVDAASLRKAAQLFRTFGEDYHERML